MAKENIKQYLKNYIPLVDFLAEVLGKNSEVVLNDVTDLDHSVVYIKNGDLTNRKIGDPASNFVLKVMKKGLSDDKSYIANYSGTAKGHPDLRSSTYFIKKDGQLVGMLCVNTNDKPIADLLRQIDKFRAAVQLPGSEDTDQKQPANKHKPIDENFNNSVTEIAKTAVAQKEREIGVSAEYFQQEQKMDVVADLNDDGYFLLKDSIKVIARGLHVSIPTVYRYLNQVKSRQKDEE